MQHKKTPTSQQSEFSGAYWAKIIKQNENFLKELQKHETRY
jgi:hypothetical protein